MVKRTSIVLATVAMCLALAAWAMAAPAQEGPSVPAPLADAVLQGFGLTEGAFVTLDLPQAPVESISVPLELGGEDYVIRAERRSLRAPDFRMLVQDASGELREVAPPAPRTYRGSLEGHPGSRVGLSLTVGGGLEGSVQRDSKPAWYVQPASRGVPGADTRPPRLVGRSDVAGHRLEAVRSLYLDAPCGSAADDRFAQGVFGVLLRGRGQTQDIVGFAAGSHDIGDGGFALGEGARLV